MELIILKIIDMAYTMYLEYKETQGMNEAEAQEALDEALDGMKKRKMEDITRPEG